MTPGSLLFVVCSALAIAGALVVVLSKNPIRGALGLLGTIIGIAGLFLRLNAQFLAAIQLLVYAGAVVILFVFVIMLIGTSAQTKDVAGATVKISRAIGGGIVGVLGVVSLGLIGFGDQHPFQVITPAHGSVEAVGSRIFREGLVPFELATGLLIVAVVGAIAVARTQPGAKTAEKKPEEAQNATRRLFHGPVVAKDAPWPGDRGEGGRGEEGAEMPAKESA
jgi:NADH-quinone oxidoreductase subunit J